jgi:threonine dehydratase
MSTVSIDDVRAARARVRGVVKVTPLEPSATFSALCGRQIHLKLENLQKTGSFKVRGALNKVHLLDAGARERGVVTASAGNHAPGLAYAARMIGVPVTVVMPETASFAKVEATSGYGAEVILHGCDYGEAYERAAALVGERGATYVHAFDDPDVIAGQGTLGLEVLEQMPDLDTIVVPVGGGGLLAGVAAALRGAGCRARIIGVEAAGASALRASLEVGSPVNLTAGDTIADGLATGGLGETSFELVQRFVDEAVEVSDSEIAAAILLLLEREKTVVEGAGAAGLAACLSGRLPAAAEKVVVVVSGGNIDTNLLDRIINLGLVAEGRLFRFTTELRDRPGELQRLIRCVVSCAANIHQIRHERARPGLGPTRAAVTLELETRGRDHVLQIDRALAAAGFARSKEDDA